MLILYRIHIFFYIFTSRQNTGVTSGCKMALQIGVRRSCSAAVRCLPNVIDGHPILTFAGGTTQLPIATLRATFGEKYPYEEPFPYEKWPLHAFALSQDYTEWRFNENTKVFL